MKIGNFQGSNKFEQMEKINKKINMGYMENKKEKNIINKKSILSTFFTSILKFSLAVALLTILAFFVAAGDVIVESGKLNVSNNLYVNDNGNVGIGTVSPSNKLHIKNTGANNILIVDSGDGITQRYSALDLYDNGALKWGLGKNPAGNFYIDLGGVGNVLTITQSNGNVGIGTTGPGQKLDVDLGNIVVQGTGSFDVSGEEGIVYLGDTSHYIKSVFGSGVRIGTYGVGDAITILQSSGNVGIRTTNPSEALEVAGNIKLSGSSPTYKITNIANPTTSSDVATKAYVDSAAGSGEGEWTAVTLKTGWANYPGWQNVQYKKVGNLVYLRGLVDRPSPWWWSYPLIFDLPSGYRPSATAMFVQPGYAGSSGAVSSVEIDIATTGEVSYRARDPDTAGYRWISFDGIVFSVN